LKVQTMNAKPFQLPLCLLAALVLACLGGQSFHAAAQKQRPPVKRTLPATPPPPTSAQSSTATFRVVLNGFTVNNESDDDIFERDGRGDEVFITSNAWHFLKAEGGAVPLSQIRTKVMGEARGHPGRVSAGSGGLRTGDSFPSSPAWERTRGTTFADRPPTVLWIGSLTRGRDAVLILPIIWEWDSDDVSASQRSVEQALPSWIVGQQLWLDHLIDYPLDIVYRVVNARDAIPLGGKAGTRPIGYAGEGGAFGVGAHDHLTPQVLALTYDSAVNAVQNSNCGVPGVYAVTYADEHDHGNYTLYLQVEQGPTFKD
jgi:hypothetical protein